MITATFLSFLGIGLVLATIAIDYIMFAVVLPRVFAAALKKQADKYNPKTNEGLNVDVAYNQNFSGINAEVFGLHLRGQNIGSIIDTVMKMIAGKKGPDLVNMEIEKVLKSDIPNDEKFKKIIQLIR